MQARWLPRFASGELWITNAYSEVGTKSVNDFKTTITRDGAGWRLNGRKFYCTGSLAGDLTFGPCRIEGTDEVRVFYTPTDARRRDHPRRLDRIRPADHGQRHDRVRATCGSPTS